MPLPSLSHAMDTDHRRKIAPIFRRNLRPSSQETPDLIASLPPELRNRVYELAVSDYLEADHIRKESGKRPKVVKQYGVWREPPLLKLSKLCRGEAAPIWYKRLSFRAEDGLNNQLVGRYMSKIRSVISYCGPHPFDKFTIQIKSGAWDKLGVLLEFLEVIRATGFEPASEEYQPRVLKLEGRPPLNVTSDTSIFSIGSSDYGTLQKVLEQAVALGRKARDQGWTQEKLSGQFAQWKRNAVKKRK